MPLLFALTKPEELDSWMYQTVGHRIIQAYGECMGLPLFRQSIKGTPKQTGMQYQATEEDEVEDLYKLLLRVKVAVCGERGSYGAA